MIGKTKSSKEVKEPKESFISCLKFDLRRNKSLLFLCIPAIAYFLVFSYTPLIGLVVAFQKFSPAKGIFGSEFVGFDNFEFFIKSPDFYTVTFNTLFLNAIFISTTMFTSIVIAILIFEINNKIFKRVTQSIVILPHFISWTVIALISEALLKTNGGMFNLVLNFFGKESISFYQTASAWPGLLTVLRIWQGAGYGSILYLATLTGIDEGVIEAARIDGANSWGVIRYIKLPLLRGTAVLLLIMSVGKIFNGDFGMIYALVGANSLLYPTTDVIDTYVYRQLMESNNMGLSSAVGLYQSIMGLIMVLVSNQIARRIDRDSAMF